MSSSNDGGDAVEEEVTTDMALDHAETVVKPDSNFIAGLKRLAEERRAAKEDEANNKEKATIINNSIIDKTHRQLNKLETKSSHEKDDVGHTTVNVVDNKRELPDMTGKVISVTSEDQNNHSSTKQDQQRQQQEGKDKNRNEPKQRQKKKSGKSGPNPKKKSTTPAIEDGSLPDMTGKEIVVDQLELPENNGPVKEEVDLDDLIYEEQISSSMNKGKGKLNSSLTSGGGGASSMNQNNRRGQLSKIHQISQRSNATSSTTSGTDGSLGGGSGVRPNLFALYNDPSQRSLLSQVTSHTSKDSEEGSGDDMCAQQDYNKSESADQLPQKSDVIRSLSPNRRPANSLRHGRSSSHQSSYCKPTTLRTIPSSGAVEDQTLPLSTSLSWTSLIALDEKKKRESMETMQDVAEEPPHRHRKGSSGLNTSWTSARSDSSKNSHGSDRESASRRSKRSSGGSRRSNRGSSGRRQTSQSENLREDWRNESTMSITPTFSQMKDPEYIRSQAFERFERGLHYAEFGKLDAARERFLAALRYRVMDRGSLHPDVAATHEMLGHVFYFMAENTKNDDFEGSLVRLDEGADGLLGVLDILDAKELNISNETVSDWMKGGDNKDETTFQWKEIAETYSSLDDKGRLGVEKRIEIVTRIQARMDELPVTVGEKSYVRTFVRLPSDG
ncbi:hypothetical protein ACHAWC_006166 [Mediolabrus comicus]